jgi:RND family efflux transporter MFP subunit
MTRRIGNSEVIMRTKAILAVLPILAGLPATAADTYRVEAAMVEDLKPVFATVEGVTLVPARAQAAGSVAQLTVREGDKVAAGQVVALLSDPELAARLAAAAARIDAARALQEQAQRDLDRNRPLVTEGVISPMRLEELETAAKSSAAALRIAEAERDLLQSATRVLAPAAGRVMQVPISKGSVVMGGEAIATIATAPYRLKLRIPESLAAGLAQGGKVRLDQGMGTIALVYPQIVDGKVIADVQAQDFGDYFVGQRVQAFVALHGRRAVLLPPDYVTTRYGLDYVLVKQGDGTSLAVPVQRGAANAGEIEILSGLRDGDIVVKP